MSVRSGVRRAAAGMSAVVLGAGLAVALGAGTANADNVNKAMEGVYGGTGSAFDVSRMISGNEVSDDGGVAVIKQGARVTITNTLNRTKGGHLGYWLKDEHPTCFEPVADTSVWMVSGKEYSWESNPREVHLEEAPGVVKLGDSGGWTMKPLTWSQDYVVNCDITDGLASGGLIFSTNLRSSDRTGAKDIGPVVNVVAGDGNGGDNGNGSSGNGDGGDNGNGNGSSGNGDGGDNGNGSSGNGDGGDNGGNSGAGNNGNGASTGSGFLSSVDIFGSLFK